MPYFDPRSYDDRFDSRVERTDGCWLWTAAVAGNGYGAFFDGERMTSAHIYAFTRIHGPIPKGTVIRHTCDVKICVRPDHLLSGSHVDNARDRSERGRTATGERNGFAKLNEEAVMRIRERYEIGDISQAALARQFNVSVGTIWNVVNRTLWKAVA